MQLAENCFWGWACRAPKMKAPLDQSGAGDYEGCGDIIAPGADLAAEINAEHERAFGKAHEAVEHARCAGELLLQAKGAVGHGAWDVAA